MAIISISISATEDGHLILTDSEGHTGEDNITTYASDSDSIIWILAENSGISALTGIDAKEGSENLFSDGPNKVSDSEWRGVIAPTATGTESYYIKYILNDGEQRRDDPKVVIKPK